MSATRAVIGGWSRAWEVTTDVLIATALLWVVPLVLGAVSALITLVL